MKYRISHHEGGYVVERKVWFFGWIWSGPGFRYVFDSFNEAERWVAYQIMQTKPIKEYDSNAEEPPNDLDRRN